MEMHEKHGVQVQVALERAAATEALCMHRMLTTVKVPWLCGNSGEGRRWTTTAAVEGRGGATNQEESSTCWPLLPHSCCSRTEQADIEHLPQRYHAAQLLLED